ncbi:Retrovirus-related Pol polyprotein from transposon TNT 1-94 [Sesamum angolense]|uniref:Retrovirus-related Pol polyprotein from transposon TNT 1-94 n=1 Tax=Sesamum angolense TaxID=2727404 RepID=A0AAE1T4Y0_9LAMI|nr:Retrovirus-related Pol polyprotein from transposon TNT 1-94 [Sesamum angolense]
MGGFGLSLRGNRGFLNAWKGACATDGGVVVPLGTFFVSGATFEGPCNGETFFRTKGTLTASSDPSLDQDYWILFDEIDRLTIFGNGMFYGNGESAWPHNQCDKTLGCKKPPTGISIGSLGKYNNEEDVVGITVKNCTFSDTDNGLRVKTWAPSSMPVTVSTVTFTDINVYNLENPIIIDQYYCPHSSCSRKRFPLTLPKMPNHEGSGKDLFALRTSISREFIDHVRDINSPKQVWDTLERLFSKKNTARLQFLENELTMIKQEAEKISEARLRRFLIRGLQKEYNPYVTSVQGWEKQPSVEELESLLSNQEALAKQMAKNFNFEQDVVLFSRGKMNDSERDANEKKRSRTKLSRANVACEDNDGNNESDQLNWEQCFTTEVVEESDSANIGSTSNQAQINYANYKDEWIIDSGCSHHVTEGAVKIDADETSVKLDDVYHVPGLKKNLISVSQITNSGKYVLFGPNDVKVLDNVKNVAADVIISGERKGSLFVISVGEAYIKKTSQTDSAATWHARLGHVGYQMLQQISSKRLLDGLPTLKNVHEDVVCQGCQYGKSHHLPFKMSSNRRTTSLELIHTDLMGPTRTPSCSHNHYVMVLVDDYSRYTWTYFLKEKNEALSKFVEFRNKVEKELGQKVKCLRSDNGGEFMSADFFQYCDNNGIQRQMTCPNTPQQNGVAERKLAHLISTSLSWLHDKNLPRELWAEAIECACYVINRLPPWPGKEKAPFEILYGVKPNVNYFRVFGSICYVHVPKNNRTKLDAKAKKCIFVGYDTCRKEWRCMDPTTKKSITSRDVVFDEISSWKTVDELPKVAALPDNSEKQIYQN